MIGDIERGSIEVLYTLKPRTEVGYQIVKGTVGEKKSIVLRGRMGHMFIDNSMESREKYSKDADSAIIEDVSFDQLMWDDLT